MSDRSSHWLPFSQEFIYLFIYFNMFVVVMCFVREGGTRGFCLVLFNTDKMLLVMKETLCLFKGIGSSDFS